MYVMRKFNKTLKKSLKEITLNRFRLYKSNPQLKLKKRGEDLATVVVLY